jgi:hypothetical protein
MDSLSDDRFQLTDYRRPGLPMTPLALKLPQEATEQLGEIAKRWGCTRTAVGRALLLRGLAEMVSATASSEAGAAKRTPLQVVVD